MAAKWLVEYLSLQSLPTILSFVATADCTNANFDIESVYSTKKAHWKRATSFDNLSLSTWATNMCRIVVYVWRISTIINLTTAQQVYTGTLLSQKVHICEAYSCSSCGKLMILGLLFTTTIYLGIPYLSYWLILLLSPTTT